MGIVNPGTSVLYTDIPADVLERIEDVVLNRRSDAAERLIELADRLKEASAGNTSAGQPVKHDAWRDGTVEERLQYALVKGIGKRISVPNERVSFRDFLFAKIFNLFMNKN